MNTVFRYNPVGSLTKVDYPAGTDLQFEYDALQRRTKMVDAIGTTTYTYTVGSGMSLIAEDGPWASDTLTVTNRLGRRLGLHLQQPSGPTWSQVHTYDTGGRLATVASTAGTFTHSYTATASGHAGTLLQRVLLLTTGGTTYLNNRYGNLGRTLSTQLRRPLTNLGVRRDPTGDPPHGSRRIGHRRRLFDRMNRMDRMDRNEA